MKPLILLPLILACTPVYKGTDYQWYHDTLETRSRTVWRSGRVQCSEWEPCVKPETYKEYPATNGFYIYVNDKPAGIRR